MYSVVLMAALTTGTSAPDWHCHSHSSGYGYGYACSGWYGAWAGNGCVGCSGWYPGYAYGGGYGGGYGYGGGGFGCYGGTWGGWGSGIDYTCFGCHGCYGCYGGFGCYGYSPYGPGGNIPEQIPAPRVEEKKPGGQGAVTPDRARVIVQLPADAKLYVDDQPVKAGAERQTFSTPQLQRGQTYFYDVRAEVVRDGKTLVENKRVLVRAGQEVSVTFPKLEAPPTGIAGVNLPGGR
jgi:uncharacterized protein (TIGR03000 family)